MTAVALHPSTAGSWRVRLRGTVGRYPLTLGALVVLLAAGLATGSLVSGPSPALQDAVGAGAGSAPWGLLVSGLWTSGAGSFLAVVAAVLLLLPQAERRLGGRLTLAGLLAGQVLGTAVGVGVIAVRPGPATPGPARSRARWSSARSPGCSRSPAWPRLARPPCGDAACACS